MFDIDLVVPWVDGSDPAWLEEKRKYTAKVAQSDGENRYRDWGILKYLFRSIDAYLPWVRTVHFITWGHLPDFMKMECEKLHIVNHRDYLPKEILPTYSSHVIEINMHRIQDLAEHFIYINDDMYFARPLLPDDFFDGRMGYPRLPFWEAPLRFTGAANQWSVTSSSNIGLINKHFSKRSRGILEYPGRYLSTKYSLKDNVRTLAMKALFPEYYAGFKNYHGPAVFLKSTFEEVWNKEQELLNEENTHKFRELDDVNQWLFLWWQLAAGQFAPKKNGNVYYEINDANVGTICNAFRRRSADSICINDPDYPVDVESLSKALVSMFEEVFPEKSCFEI